jgi:hypothetical protein
MHDKPEKPIRMLCNLAKGAGANSSFEHPWVEVFRLEMVFASGKGIFCNHV